MTSTWVSERFLLALRSDVFRHVQGLSLGFFERRRLGDVLSRITGDVDAVETFLLSGVADGLYYVIRLGVFLGLLFYLRWDLTILALVIVPLFWCAARRFSRLIKAASRERRRRSGSISAIAEESLGNIALVQAYNRQETEEHRFARESVGKFRAAMASARIHAVYSPIVEVIELTGALAVMGLGTWKLAQGQLTLGGLLVFLALLSSLYSPIRGLSHLTNTFYAASASAERIIELLDQRPQVVEAADARRIGRARGDVEFRGVSFRYPGTSRWALSDVSFQVTPGTTLALVGASGAGKSTVGKLQLRFYDPDQGSILLDGTDLRDLQLSELRENVAVVLQETLVFHGTVRENIAYGRPDAAEADIVAAAHAADAHDFIQLLPEGYDTVVGQRGRTLSGGQAQRLAIARAMIRDAPVLILDEPTTGLDTQSGRRIMEPLQPAHGRADHHRHLPQSDHHPRRHLHRGVGRRPGRRARHARGPAPARRGLRPASPAERSDRPGPLRLPIRSEGSLMSRAMSRPVPPLAPGAIPAPGYEVLAHLARTGWLDLYDAWSEERDCRCVVKVLRPDHRHEEQLRDRLLREGRWLRTFTHPHLVRAYETFESPEPLVVLETLTGETLAHLIGRSRRMTGHRGRGPSRRAPVFRDALPPRSRPVAPGPQAVQRRRRLRARQSARPERRTTARKRTSGRRHLLLHGSRTGAWRAAVGRGRRVGHRHNAVRSRRRRRAVRHRRHHGRDRRQRRHGRRGRLVSAA